MTAIVLRPAERPAPRRIVWEMLARRGAVYLLLSFLSSLTLFPFLWLALLSTHDRTTIFSGRLPLHVGSNIGRNYETLLGLLPFWTNMWNSIWVAGMATTASLVLCSLGGFAFAAYEFKGKRVMFGMLVASMMVPPILNLIPYYLVIKFLNLMDTHVAIWLPLSITPVGVFLVRQYISASVPLDLFEAARIEGATEFQIFRKIALPLIRPALATLAIIQFVAAWNTFLAPLVVLKSKDMFVLTLALRSIQSVANSPWGAIMLGTLLAILPLLVFFLFASRQIMQGLTSGAVKS